MSVTLLWCVYYQGRQPSTKGFCKNEIHVKEFIVSPSSIFTKNETLLRFFEVLCPSCRIPFLQNISRWLLLKQPSETMFHLPLFIIQCMLYSLLNFWEVIWLFLMTYMKGNSSKYFWIIESSKMLWKI